MGFFEALARFFSRLFGSSDDRPEIERSNAPLSKETMQFDSEQIDITIHQTVELTGNNDRIPEQLIAEYLAKALTKAQKNYRIRYNFDPVVVGTEKSVCGDDSAYEEWQDLVNNEQVESGEDSNILLTNADGGGCGSVGGRVATAPGGLLDEMQYYDKVETGRYAGNIHSSLHEFAHNMGIGHDADKEKEGKQHGGMGWNENGYWHRTPSVAGHGAPNRCGEEVEERDNRDVMHHQYFWDCAVENFKK